MIRGKLLLIAIAGAMIVPLNYDRARAEEAATSPTCTGCSGSKSRVSQEAKPHRQKVNRSEASSSGRGAGGGVAGFNGTWAGLSTGDCIPNYNWTIYVNNGVISGTNTSGSLTRGGSVRASMLVNGSRYDVVGRASGSGASGTWVTSGDCAGRWTATKS